MNADNNVVTCDEMKAIERKAAEEGLSYYHMMENAGAGAAEFIMDQQPVKGKEILIFCGKGNNGGDGFVAARKLVDNDGNVLIIKVEGEPKTEDAIKNKEICEDMKIPMYQFTDIVGLKNLVGRPDIIVDAIYGTGFHGSLKNEIREITKFINSTKSVVYALDIPSGLNGDSGEIDVDTVIADHTIVFHSYKPAHVMKETQQYCGQCACIDIGISE